MSSPQQTSRADDDSDNESTRLALDKLRLDLRQQRVNLVLQPFKIVAGIVALLAAIHFAARLVDDSTRHGSSGANSSSLLPRTSGAPREFLYLDAVRAEAYLSQIEGGRVGTDHLSQNVTRSASGAATAGPAKVEAGTTVAQAIQRTLSPTNFSRFFSLDSLLQERSEISSVPALGGQAGEPLPAARFQLVQRALLRTHEGGFVRLSAFVRVPQFVRLYLDLRQAPARSRDGRLARRFLSEIGPDPQLPLEAVIRGPNNHTIRVILPIRFSALAAQPSLLTGRLRTLAKIVYRVPASSAFADPLLAARFAALRTIPTALIRAYSVAPRAQILRELARFVRVAAPAVLILPVAIFK